MEFADAEEELDDDDDDDNSIKRMTKEDMTLMGEIARFEFQTDRELSMGAVQLLANADDKTVNAAATAADPTTSNGEGVSNVIPLPDIKEARKKKQMEEELNRMEQEKEEQKVRIKRSDKKAFARVRYVESKTKQIAIVGMEV